jgi:hypothetical protein
VSIRYVAAVLDKLPELSASETLVLLVLADFASDDTRTCWPSMATIARRARCDKRSARRLLRRLESLELVETSAGGHQFGANTASCYRLRFGHDGERIQGTEAPPVRLSTRGTYGPQGGTVTTRKGDRDDTEGGHTVLPSVIRSVIDPKRRLKNAPEEKPRAARPEGLANISGLLKRVRGDAT